MSKEEERAVAYWYFYDSETRRLLEAGRMVRGNPQPTIGEVVSGVSDWPKALVESFELGGIEDNVPRYDVYVKRSV